MRKLATLGVVVLALAGFAMSGCIFISSSAISGSTSKSGTPISTTASDMGYLMLVAPVGLTQVADTQLMNQCPSGKVGNVVTELSNRNILGIVQLYNVQVNALCER